jgi:lysozyme family protein
MTFDEAFQILIQFEGTFVDNPADPGGATMYGITQRTARALGYMGEMKDLPVETAKNIYKVGYWAPMKIDTLPVELQYAAFDAAVNNGITHANQWLLAALQDDPAPEKALRRFMGLRLKFFTSLNTWPTFGKGWSRRVAAILLM